MIETVCIFHSPFAKYVYFPDRKNIFLIGASVPIVGTSINFEFFLLGFISVLGFSLSTQKKIGCFWEKKMISMGDMEKEN